MFLFADAFGLYRNMYRSIEGIYLISQFVSRERRLKRNNLLPAALGPFGSKLGDVFEALNHYTELDSGMELEINGQMIFVCSFVAAILGDMPSQQKLSGCLSHQANKSCRYCYINSQSRADLDFDIIEFGRYGEQLLIDSKRIRNIPVKAQQVKMASGLGVHDNWQLMDVLGERVFAFCCLLPLTSRRLA